MSSPKLQKIENITPMTKVIFIKILKNLLIFFFKKKNYVIFIFLLALEEQYWYFFIVWMGH
jgi:hypothetical protein